MEQSAGCDVFQDIRSLLAYAESRGLANKADRVWLRNGLLDLLNLDAYDEEDPKAELPSPEPSLQAVLDRLCTYAIQAGVIGDSTTERDLFDTKLMGLFTPRPSEVEAAFEADYAVSPRQATDRFYRMSCDCNYIRTERVAKDQRWTYDGKYGTLDISINLSKPEKDPKAIAQALARKQVAYPKCQLCTENVGYRGRMDHPARQNLRIVPLQLNGERWGLQYSPYVYYNEHCIVLNEKHVPMKITPDTFKRLLDFVELFPHYFIGSNADLPIVGGSILTHDHFQGGRYTFAMERAPERMRFRLKDAPAVEAAWVEWPLTVLRLTGAKEDVWQAACHVLDAWRGYTDAESCVYAETDGIPHNTVTPIARRKGEHFQLDLVLRNNLTTEEYPLGLYHPHAEKHHIKKENIGLIEVMGLAVLPARLNKELRELEERFVAGSPMDTEGTAKHADWFEEIRKRREVTKETISEVLREEVGRVFEQVLEDAGVYKPDEKGEEGLKRFLQTLGCTNL